MIDSRICIAVVVALVGCDPPPEQTAEDAAIGGGEGGASSGGSSAGSAGAPGGASGGAGGASGGGTTGGAAGSASTTYEAPVWSSIGDVGPCKVQRIINPGKVQPPFSWTSCGAGCEDGELQTWGTLTHAWMGASSVRGTGGQAQVAIQLTRATGGSEGPDLALLVDRDGKLLQAVRTDISGDDGLCVVGSVSTRGSLFGVTMAHLTPEGLIGDVFIALLPVEGDEGTRVSSVGLAPQLPQAMTMGDEVVAWHMGYSDAINTVDIAELGTARQVVPPAAAPVAWRGIAAGCGAMFLLEEAAQVGDAVLPRVTYTDGKSSSAQVYLSEPGVGYSMARCADSHVAFLRGTGQQDRVERFDKVEVWASPFTADPAALAPVRIDELSVNSIVNGMSLAGGGYGRYGFRESPSSLRVWDLEAGDKWVWTPTNGLDFGAVMGFTETELWMGTRPERGGRDVAVRRYSLPPP